jgi:hypothetical protein
MHDRDVEDVKYVRVVGSCPCETLVFLFPRGSFFPVQSLPRATQGALLQLD